MSSHPRPYPSASQAWRVEKGRVEAHVIQVRSGRGKYNEDNDFRVSHLFFQDYYYYKVYSSSSSSNDIVTSYFNLTISCDFSVDIFFHCVESMYFFT